MQNLGVSAPLLCLQTVPAMSQTPRHPPVRGQGLSLAQQQQLQQLLQPKPRHSRLSTSERQAPISQQRTWCKLCRTLQVLRDARAVHSEDRLHETPPEREVQRHPPARVASKSPKTELSLHGNPMLHQSGEQTAPLKKAQTVILHRWGGSA